MTKPPPSTRSSSPTPVGTRAAALGLARERNEFNRAAARNCCLRSGANAGIGQFLDDRVPFAARVAAACPPRVDGGRRTGRRSWISIESSEPHAMRRVRTKARTKCERARGVGGPPPRQARHAHRGALRLKRQKPPRSAAVRRAFYRCSPSAPVLRSTVRTTSNAPSRSGLFTGSPAQRRSATSRPTLRKCQLVRRSRRGVAAEGRPSGWRLSRAAV